MRIVGNILWIIFGGIITTILWFLLGCLLCVTIIGIPFGRQCFKFARLSLTPFGKTVNLDFKDHPIMNVIWAVLFGWWMAISYVLCGVVQLITIIGIPFGLQAFKFMKLAFIPFGAKIEKK